MNGKLAVGISPEESVTTSELLNPFVHHLELETTTEKVKVSVKLNVKQIQPFRHIGPRSGSLENRKKSALSVRVYL